MRSFFTVLLHASYSSPHAQNARLNVSRILSPDLDASCGLHLTDLLPAMTVEILDKSVLFSNECTL